MSSVSTLDHKKISECLSKTKNVSYNECVTKRNFNPKTIDQLTIYFNKLLMSDTVSSNKSNTVRHKTDLTPTQLKLFLYYQ